MADYRAGRPRQRYTAPTERSLDAVPPVRRDLIKRSLYLVPNSIVVTRGCPHRCDFCYKEAFFEGGNSFYAQRVDDALAEIERLPGRHLYFLDDHLLGDWRYAEMLFDGMRGMGRLFQGASTVNAVMRPGLLEKAAAAGLRSLFVGLETLSAANLRASSKTQNLGRDYLAALRHIHQQGVMVNGSFVFGMDDDDESVFDRTVDWAVAAGIETATFHIMTPYPGTGLYRRIEGEGRLLHHDWDRYDTRHAVFQPARMTTEQLESGYWRAYREFYRWGNIARGAAAKPTARAAVRNLAYAGGWKKLQWLWHLLIRARQVSHVLPLLERVLGGRHGARQTAATRSAARAS